MITWIVRGAIFVRGKKKVTKQSYMAFCLVARKLDFEQCSSRQHYQQCGKKKTEGHLITRYIERFSNDCRKTKTKANTPTNHNRNKQFLAITCHSLEAREKARVHGAIGFGFASHWLKNWRESFKPITKRSNRNHVITIDSHLKTALS